MSKDYMGKCGSCIHCDLSSGETSMFVTKFSCDKSRYPVKADESACRFFEPARGRSNEIIAQYDQ